MAAWQAALPELSEAWPTTEADLSPPSIARPESLNFGSVVIADTLVDRPVYGTVRRGGSNAGTLIVKEGEEKNEQLAWAAAANKAGKALLGAAADESKDFFAPLKLQTMFEPPTPPRLAPVQEADVEQGAHDISPFTPY